jgi:DNA-nicking Smr family endonuclease
MSYYAPTQHIPEREPDFILDLHGHTTSESRLFLDEFFNTHTHGTVRIIVGKGTRSEHGAVLPTFVHNYLTERGFSYAHAPRSGGGEGAYDTEF